MSKISALDFANNVERNRKSLRQHCLANGKDVSEAETLDNIVAMNNQITSTIDGKFKVEFKDLNGDYFAPTQYVQAGGIVTLPSTHPELEPDILEFVEWVADGDLNNVQEDLICLPKYQTKINEVANQRPTILKCYFDESTLSPPLYIGSSHTNTFIDWGDGSEAQKVSSAAVSHTYAKEGLYTILIYGDKYSLEGNTSSGIFNAANYEHVLLKAYLGENISSLGSYAFRGSRALNTIVIPNNITSIGESAFMYNTSLTSVVIPNSIKTISKNAFAGCYNLRNVVIPNTVQTIGEGAFSICYTIDNIIIPSGVTSIANDAFKNTTISNIVIPSSVSTMYNPFADAYSLSNVVLYEDYNLSINLVDCPLTDECLIDIAHKIKDNTDLGTNTIYFSKTRCFSRMKTIMLNEFGERVPLGTEGAVNIIEFMQNKNWTITFST